jgi:amino acid transporter
MSAPITPQAEQPHLIRRFGLLSATALNMTNMIGVGPFITIPLLMSALGGPQAMLGWIVALVIVICDGMVWSELCAAMPGSGGSFNYLREAFGRERYGRLMAFLFVWQFVLSGPLEIASGYIGFAQYASYIWTGLTRPGVIALVTVVGLVNIALLYRRINSIAKITISLWIGTLITVLAVIVTGAMHFNPRIAFDFPPGAFNFSIGFFLGLGAASRIGIYDYLGYYDVCYIGDEVEIGSAHPAVDPDQHSQRCRHLPESTCRSSASCLAGVRAGRFTRSRASSSDLHAEDIWRTSVAVISTLLVLWTAFGRCSRCSLVTRASPTLRRSGYFFRVFARLHPTGLSVHLAALLGAISIVAGFFSLGQ